MVIGIFVHQYSIFNIKCKSVWIILRHPLPVSVGESEPEDSLVKHVQAKSWGNPWDFCSHWKWLKTWILLLAILDFFPNSYFGIFLENGKYMYIYNHGLVLGIYLIWQFFFGMDFIFGVFFGVVPCCGNFFVGPQLTVPMRWPFLVSKKENCPGFRGGCVG